MEPVLFPRLWRAAAAIAGQLLVVLSLMALPLVTQADATLGGALKPDVRLLIDISGSMKQSDPDNLRAPALDLIVRLLPEGSKAGVWIFGEEVEQLVAHRVIDDAWRQAAQEAVAAIDNSGQRTNIPAALAAATYDLQSMDPAFRTSIVLLTDGKVDVAQSPMVNASAARELLATEAPELGATGIPVHTVALSDEADWVFLRSLSQITGGIAEEARSAGELTAIFLQSLEMVAPTARVPVAGSSFQIDDSVNEFTALIFYEGEDTRIGLVGPSGIKYRPKSAVDGVDWFSNRQFALVTVRAPEPGIWQLEAPEGATTRVTVISDLQLEVDPLPNNLPAGRHAELGLRLREHGEVVSDPEVLGLFSITVEVQGPRGKTMEIDVSGTYPLPEDGEYRVTVPPFDEPGRYQLLARIDAKTLHRELPMFVEVVATPAKPTLVTRGLELPENDLQAPLVGLGIGLLVGAVLVWYILRRRKRKRLEIWQRRSRQVNGNGRDSGLFEGISAANEGADTMDKPS
jgi:hypothetical protein